MLQHVREANGANSVLRSVDVLAGVFECAFDDERRWVASFRCACVVGAGVAALRFDVGDGAVLRTLASGPFVTSSTDLQQ